MILRKSLLLLSVWALGGTGLAAGAAEAAPAPAAAFARFDDRAQRGEALSVVFFGGSLTWGANASDPNRSSWRALMGDYLRQRYPRAPFVCHDAAIGGTGSDLGLFRLDRDVLAHKPDLVFLDFTANDDLYSADERRLATYEEILRTMVTQGIPVVQVFLGFSWDFGPKYSLDKLPRRQAHLRLAAAYHTSVADAFPYVQQQIVSGATSVKELWAIDGVHPDDAGYRLFFDVARDAYDQAVRERRVCVAPPQPVYPRAFPRHERRRLADGPLPEGWQRAKTYRTSMWFDGLTSRWMGDVAMVEAKAGQAVPPLRLEFEGSLLGLFGEGDDKSLGFRAVVDGQPLTHPKLAPEGVWPTDTNRSGKGRLFFWRLLSDKLPPGRHVLELQPVLAEGAASGQLRLESLCTAGSLPAAAQEQ